MMKHYQLIEGRVCETADTQSPIRVFVAPDEKEKRFLLDDLKVDEHTLFSALDPDELSRLEFEVDHVAVILKRPKNYSAADRFLFKVSSMGLFLFKDQLVIVMPEDVPLFENKHFARISELAGVVIKLIYRSIFHFIEHLKVINLITDSLEQKISAAMENRYLLNLFTLEKSLVYYLNAINSNGMLIEKLKNNAVKIGLSTECLELLDDTFIENTQCYKQAEIYSNILSSLMDARASIVGNNLNVLMKTLNIITISIMMPTLVVSLFSMNVSIPLSRHPLAFWLILSLSAVSVIGLILFWKYKKWI